MRDGNAGEAEAEVEVKVEVYGMRAKRPSSILPSFSENWADTQFSGVEEVSVSHSPSSFLLSRRGVVVARTSRGW